MNNKLIIPIAVIVLGCSQKENNEDASINRDSSLLDASISSSNDSSHDVKLDNADTTTTYPRIELNDSGADIHSESDCIPGQFCGCPYGVGVTVCDDGGSVCNCPECNILELTEIPSIEPCGGEPFGTWRLTHIESGKQKLTVKPYYGESGECDAERSIKQDNIDKVLIELIDGGGAKYTRPEIYFTNSWNVSCATGLGLDAEHACTNIISEHTTGGDYVRFYDIDLEYSTCTSSCDICTCEGNWDRYWNGTFVNNNGSWRRTETTLSFDLWDVMQEYSYCISGDTLSLSNNQAYMEFERIVTLGTPMPCADRSVDECENGGGCYVGACVGDNDCEGSRSESSCLTHSGCDWEENACSGTAESRCSLNDYGVVPGCYLNDQPLASRKLHLA